MARRAELVGIVRPEVDDRAADREASQLSQTFDKAASLTPDIDTRSLQRKLERVIPGGGLLGSAFDRVARSGGGGGQSSGGGDGDASSTALLGSIREKLEDIEEVLEKSAATQGGGGGGGGFLHGLLAGRGLSGGGGLKGLGALGGAGGFLAMAMTPGSSIKDKGDVGPGAKFLSNLGSSLGDKLNLPDLSELKWPDFPQLPDFSQLSWPSLPDLPNLGKLSWPDMPDPPNLQNLQWPSLPGPLQDAVNVLTGGGGGQRGPGIQQNYGRPSSGRGSQADQFLYNKAAQARQENRAKQNKKGSVQFDGPLDIRIQMPDISRVIENALNDALQSRSVEQLIIDTVQQEVDKRI